MWFSATTGDACAGSCNRLVCTTGQQPSRKQHLPNTFVSFYGHLLCILAYSIPRILRLRACSQCLEVEDAG